MCTPHEISDEPILYELLEYFVREQEPELIKCKNDTVVLPATGTIKNALRYLNNRYSLPESISQQVSLVLPWKFAVGDHGRVLAILQENVIEIRKAKDEYSSVVGKTSAPKDVFPQWRKIAWSPDGTILALASSSGYTSFYNTLGNNIFNISPKTNSQNPHILEAGDAIASMLFLKPRVQDEKWTYEFILITYSGLLRSYHICTTGFSANYNFSFGNFYKNGVNAVVYDEKRHLFYVAGNMITQKLTSPALESGLTAWRLLNEDPYCKLSFAFENSANNNSRFFIWNFIPMFNTESESIIFTTKISPNGEFLACLHTDGSVSLWGLPNLVLQKRWKLHEQPEYNIPNPSGLSKCKHFPGGFTEFHPIDIGWWSDQAIIIARYNGSTSVCSTWNLNNLLGVSPEFLAGQPQVCELGSEKGFLCIDCETFVTSKKRSREPSDGHISEASSESEREDDELEPITILNYTTNLIRSTLYTITDIEKFQPKRKKLKVLHRTYRILGLKSTTPEELYSRKIDIEEYDEALALAKTYNLDTDLVYQTQWRKSELSLNAIDKHLSKVSKRSWVLNECITRVPDTMEAARELLNFGLRGANLETLIAIDTNDNDKFVIPDMDDDWQTLDESTVNLMQMQKINEMLEKIDIKNLSEAQKNLIKYRRKLLSHLDKLLTYDIMLESPLKYKKEFYEEFRRLSAVENAIRFAKDGNYGAVEIMFTYYAENLLPHWLAILSFFPETLNPSIYQKLLPECDSEGQLFLLDQRELRQKDWSEKSEFNEVINFDMDDRSDILYELDPSLSTYKNMQFTSELLQKWYKTRAYQIEKNSCMVDNALQLIKIAKSHNINGLEDLLLDLETLDDLVYKIGIEDISICELEKLSNVEKIKLLMNTSTEKNFVENIKNLLLPFIKRRYQYLGGDLQKHLLSDYLICLSKTDLMLPVKFFGYLKQIQETEIIQMIDDVAELAINCIYSCDDLDMYEKAKTILDSIPKNDGKRTATTCNLLEQLDRELDCTRLLGKYGVKTTLKFIRNKKDDPDIAKTLLNQMARGLNKKLSRPDEKEWTQLLHDMLEIQGLIFPCIIVETCFEICVSARLVSGVISTIQNCSTLIETKKNEKSPLKVSYEKTIDLILEATKEYFNGSKTLTDPNMKLATACLHLIEDDNIKIREEYDLIKSLQILNEFNVDILPLQVRLTPDRLTLIELCLQNQQEAYSRRKRLLTLAAFLRIEGTNDRLREGKVFELIGNKAFEANDYVECADICKELMYKNYIPAWEICLKLGCCNAYENFEFREQCLWFAINNGSSDILTNALEHVAQVKIQILEYQWKLSGPFLSYLKDFSSLERTEESPEHGESDESEDHFTDAMTTPQTETKEFVPKMLETSTGVIKSTANLMKKSTYGLMKNISDTSFWKSRWRLNFAKSSETDTQYENRAESSEEGANLQSFPCYYQSLHETCRTSTTETKYDKYSMPDIPVEILKCCRILIRIAMLNESCTYGKEVSTLDYLFLESVKHTISDDWLLGMSYLLNLGEDHISDIQEIFMKLPHNELSIQTALYYYSLQLYKKMYPDREKLYLYSPTDLIKNMSMVAAIHLTEKSDIVEALRYWEDLLEIQNNETKEEGQMKDTSTIESVQDGNDIQVASSNEQVDESEAIDSDKIDYVHWANVTGDWEDSFDDDIEAISDKKDMIKSEQSEKTFSPLDMPPIDNDVTQLCVTEEDRFKLFQEMFNEINDLEQYWKVKKLMIEWPIFSSPDHTTLDNHPVLKMIKEIIPLLTKTNATNYKERILQEHEELIGLLTSKEILKEFLEIEQNHIGFEESIYIRLCSDNASMCKETVDLINKRTQIDVLQPLILEKLFLNDLTGSFEPSHPVYNQIIEHVFTNKSSIDIEKHTKLLIQELMKQKYTLAALYLLKLIKNIPSALCTFDTCYQALMKEN